MRRGIQMYTRRLLLGFVAVASVLAAAPAGAGAAITIGETFDPMTLVADGTQCGSDATVFQTVSPGPSYAAPSAGVITSWSFQADPVIPSRAIKFKVARSAPGANLNVENVDLTVIAESASVTPASGVLNTYPVQIPVQAGDVIGMYVSSAMPCDRQEDTLLFKNHFRDGDVPPGTTGSYNDQSRQLDLAANLETERCRGRSPTFAGTPGNDTLTGTPGPDVMVGLGGKDTIAGLAGRDVICGGTGRDTLKGGKGKDKLLGQKGADKLRGGGGNDTCKGGKGRDVEKSC